MHGADAGPDTSRLVRLIVDIVVKRQSKLEQGRCPWQARREHSLKLMPVVAVRMTEWVCLLYLIEFSSPFYY
jgi:hypothetical protein